MNVKFFVKETKTCYSLGGKFEFELNKSSIKQTSL